MSEGSATVRSFVLTATFTGAILAFAGTTLYWARVTNSVGAFYLVRLADLNRLEAPIAVVSVVLAAGILINDDVSEIHGAPPIA